MIYLSHIISVTSNWSTRLKSHQEGKHVNDREFIYYIIRLPNTQIHNQKIDSQSQIGIVNFLKRKKETNFAQIQIHYCSLV